MKLRWRHARWLSWAAALTVVVAAPTAWGLANIAISQHNLRFSQPKISIQQGDTVTFSNDDDVTHNISVRSGDEGDTEDLGLQKPKISVSHRFDQKGVYSVVCSIHPKMRLMVSVN